jgi:hypothetical protein
MKAKRSPARGPLVTFALMLGSVGAVVAISRFVDSHPKTHEPTTMSASASDGSQPGRPQ